MIPSKDTSRRFVGLGTASAKVKRVTKPGAEALAKAKGLENEIAALDKAKRDAAWCNQVSGLNARVSKESFAVRFYIKNLSRLGAMMLELPGVRAATRIDTTPSPTPTQDQRTRTPLPRPTNRPRPTPTPPPPTPTPTPRETYRGTTELAPIPNFAMLAGFNVPTVIFAILAFLFRGAFNIWMGFAMLFFLAASSFVLLGSDTREFVPKPLSRLLNTLPATVPFASTLLMIIFYSCDMPSTAIFTWIGTIAAAFLLSCENNASTDFKDREITPMGLGLNAVHLSFTVGAICFCLYLDIGWLTWVLGIIAMLATVIFTIASADDNSDREWFVPFLYIPAFIFGINAIVNFDCDAFGSALLSIAAATALDRLFLRGADSGGALLFRSLSGYLLPVCGTLFGSHMLFNSSPSIYESGAFEVAQMLLLGTAIASVIIAFDEKDSTILGAIACLGSSISSVLFLRGQLETWNLNGEMDLLALLLGSLLFIACFVLSSIRFVFLFKNYRCKPKFLWRKGHIVTLILGLLTIGLVVFQSMGSSIVSIIALPIALGGAIVAMFSIFADHMNRIVRIVVPLVCLYGLYMAFDASFMLVEYIFSLIG